MALRIRGAKTELEELGDDTEGMVESIAKLRDLIKGISGVDIMLDANTFKSTYQIIDELGRVWKQLSDIDQAALLEAIAGKRQSNIVASTLNNYERLEEILRISKESAGSAMKEQKEYAKSIQYSIDRARAAYQELAQTFIDKGVLKDLIDTGAALLTIASGIVKLAKALEPFIKLTNQVVLGNSGGLRKVIDDLGNFSGTVFGDESYVDELSESVRVLAKDSELLAENYTIVNDAIEQYKSIVESGVDVENQLLSLQTSLIASFGDEAEAIDIVNGKYEDTISNIKQLSEKEYKEWFAENADMIAEAKKLSQLDVGWIQTKDKYYDITDYSSHKDFYNKGLVTDQTVSNIYKIKDVSEDIEEIWQQIDGIEFLDGVITNDIIFSGTVEDAKNQLEQLIFIYGNMENYNKETLEKLKTRYTEISTILENIDKYLSDINYLSAAPIPESYVTSTENIRAIKLILEGIEETRDEWFKSLDEMESGAFKTVDAMGDALKKMASGEALSSSEFWDIMKQDTNNLLTDVTLIGDQFVINEKQLKALRSQYIDNQISSLKETNNQLVKDWNNEINMIKEAQIELRNLGRRGLSNEAYRKEYDEAKASIEKAQASLARYGKQIYMNNILMEQWKQKYDQIVDRQKELEDSMKKLQEQADNYSKAMTKAIDNVIDGLNDEKEQLEDEKELLDNQLDILNERKETIEDTIEQYKNITSVIKDVTNAEIDALKERQEAEENAIQERIDFLKEQHDQQEEENALVEKQLDLRQKLADLDKAKSTKVRTYSAERGWHFDVDREAVATAETAVSEAQKAYDEALREKQYNDEIEALEKEKKLISDNYDEQIKAYEDYYDQWEEITNEQTKAEQEQLAEQILGSEWREAIKRKDTNIINKFASDFRSYNAQLDSLVKGEIASLKKSIEAKQNEIDAKNKQIESWQKYKTEVSDAIDKISGKYDDYLELLGKINLTENSTYEERERALREFLPKYEALIDEIKGYQDKIGKVTISIDVDDTEARRKLLEFYSDVNTYKAIAEMERALADAPQTMRLWFDQYKEMLGFSGGGTADFTGAAMLHGTKRKAETIFTSGQSKELYDMVKSGSFVSQVADRAYAGLSTAISKMSNSTDNSSRVININGLTIKTENPAQFHEQFISEIGKYWNVKLSEARVR